MSASTSSEGAGAPRAGTHLRRDLLLLAAGLAVDTVFKKKLASRRNWLQEEIVPRRNRLPPKRAPHVYLAKANNELISHCKCVGDDAVVMSPAQKDCPWCGCGWLFTCLTCQKAFTFAMGIETDVPWSDLARRDLKGRHSGPIDDMAVAEWVTAMQEFTAGVVPGEVYVYLDGGVLPAKATPVQFMGWHAMHSFDFVPQVNALNDRSVLTETLENRDYWLKQALPATD